MIEIGKVKEIYSIEFSHCIDKKSKSEFLNIKEVIYEFGMPDTVVRRLSLIRLSLIRKQTFKGSHR